MYLLLTPAGTPVWRSKYRFAGKERLYAIGTYPDVSLEAARAARDEIKGHLREGRDPVQVKRVHKAAEVEAAGVTFRLVAEEFLEKRKGGWSLVHYKKSRQAFERDIYPRLGALPISRITASMVADTIEAVLKRGARDTAAKLLQHCSSVFRLAQAKGLSRENPADPVREILPRRMETRSRPALTTWNELGAILRAADSAHLTPVVRMAHRLCAFTAVRISNVVEADWTEFRLEDKNPCWIIPRAKMKARDRAHDHKVMLCPGIAEELRRWRTLGPSKGHVFPSPAGRSHISRESLEKAYRVTLKLADKHSPHGWRAAFSTLARDHGFERDVVELALDHVHDNDVVRAYDRGQRLEQRIALMTWWGSQLSQAQLPSGSG